VSFGLAAGRRPLHTTTSLPLQQQLYPLWKTSKFILEDTVSRQWLHHLHL
jgi:hypothetical protein